MEKQFYLSNIKFIDYEKYYIIFLLVWACGCSPYNLVKKKYPFKHAIATIRIPKDGNESWEVEDGSDETLFLYKDSAIIYLTRSNPYQNSNNIKKLGDSIHVLRFSNLLRLKINNNLGDKNTPEILIPVLPEKYELSGVGVDLLYWKDILIKGISIGYSNVSHEKKVIFDTALKTIHFKKAYLKKWKSHIVSE